MEDFETIRKLIIFKRPKGPKIRKAKLSKRE